MQILVVAVVVLLCAAYVARMLWRTWAPGTQGKSVGCGGCSGSAACGAARPAQPCAAGRASVSVTVQVPVRWVAVGKER